MGPGAATVWANASEYVKRLATVVDAYDWAAADEVVNELIAKIGLETEPYPEKAGREMLYCLRSKCRFESMARLADALRRDCPQSAQIKRQHAQALIDTGQLSAAEILLEALAKDSTTSPNEAAEALGLLGRVYKQLYVNGAYQQPIIQTAVQYYAQVYRDSGYRWHGINTIALLERARRDGVSIDMGSLPEPSAEKILAEIDDLPQKTGWDRATAVEANVALGRHEAALEEAVYFVNDPAVNAFEVASLRRQLVQVWGLTPSKPPGSALLPQFDAALLKKQGMGLQLGREDVKNGLEAVFDPAKSYESFAWYRTGLERCQAVARIEDKVGRKVGTGFLIDRKKFLGRAGAEPVLLTNHHVISDRGFPNSTTFDNAVAVFEASGKTYKVKKLLWTSPVEQLDATFVSLEPMDPKIDVCPIEPAPDPFAGPGKQRVYVIGYPLGGGLSVSLQDSIWLDTDGVKVHYRTPTEPGSSGSPVFDQRNWSLLALHHAGRGDMPRLNGQPGTYAANEGVAVAKIIEAVRQRTQSQPK